MISDGVITITDPTSDPPTKRGPLTRLFGPLIRDERDMPFIRLSLFLTLVFSGAAVYMFVPGNFRWWMAPIWMPTARSASSGSGPSESAPARHRRAVV
jgi:hypothetical protein